MQPKITAAFFKQTPSLEEMTKANIQIAIIQIPEKNGYCSQIFIRTDDDLAMGMVYEMATRENGLKYQLNDPTLASYLCKKDIGKISTLLSNKYSVSIID